MPLLSLCALRLCVNFSSLIFALRLCLVRLSCQLGRFHELNSLLERLVECLGMQVVTSLHLALRFLDRNAMLVGVSVSTDAGHLPRHFDIRRTGLDRETIALDSLSD